MIADSRKVLDTTTTDQDDRVFLEVMANARDICAHLDAIGEAHTGHFAERRVGFLGCRGVHPYAHPSFLRIPLQCWATSACADFSLVLSEPTD